MSSAGLFMFFSVSFTGIPSCLCERQKNLYLNGDYQPEDRIVLGIHLAQKMLAALKATGINTEKDLSISYLGSAFKKYFLKQRDVLKSKSYSLVVRDAYIAGKVIAAL
jgi:hypothetical protein